MSFDMPSDNPGALELADIAQEQRDRLAIAAREAERAAGHITALAAEAERLLHQMRDALTLSRRGLPVSVKPTALAAVVAKRGGSGKMKPTMHSLLTAIQNTVAERGQRVRQEGTPEDVPVVQVADVRKRFNASFEGGVVDPDPIAAKKQAERRKKAFTRTLDALRAAGLVDSSDGYVWVPADRQARAA